MTSLRQRLMLLAIDGNTASIQHHAEIIDAAFICKTKEAAMAFGYLLGQEDAKNEVSFLDPSVREQVVSVVEQFSDGEFDQDYAAQLIFGLVYKWLDKVYEDQGYASHGDDEFSTRWYLADAFQPFVKPGVISPPLSEKEEQ